MQAQDAKAAHGHTIREAMLAGHARQANKNKRLREPSPNSDESDKENAPLTLQSTPTSTRGKSQPPLSAKRRREEGFDKLTSMFQSTMERQGVYHKNQNLTNEALISEHRRANDEPAWGVKRSGPCVTRCGWPEKPKSALA